MSNLITKTIAEQVAEKLVLKVTEKIKATEIEFADCAAEIHFSHIPENDLNHIQKIDKNYLNNQIYLRFKQGEYYQDIRMPKSIVCNGSIHYVVISESEMEGLKKYESEISKLNHKKNVLRVQIVAQLLKLRSYTKIEKDFPEAFVLLPDRESVNLPAIDIKNILMQIENI
jgi:hypothetical protein